ncbi:MAG: 2-amino-4-hydroxy-6-hydroxymethyldihydropteridine diphosphokinase [Deltaproteobacteria bacterium]|nr:2-amino-4-hydroxy-6-hydroxymethyldihydropteridine diphosphokinase [Deltaproteobacteria bacterium]MBT6492268.1 2-amino-4-hydroxy-6-hydroxymethyldihydropteridine diphosphokinase [Deltaproteobacteria bacterium]
MSENRIFIALGGNIGDVLDAFRGAIIQLASQEVVLKQCSRAYQTKALLADNSSGELPAYWNCVIEVETSLKPVPLLSAIQSVENSLGRVRHKRWESRTIDLDIILYGNQSVNSDTLTIPHCEMHRRAFVLDPLVDIASDFMVPGFGKTVGQLAAELVRAPDETFEVRENWL